MATNAVKIRTNDSSSSWGNFVMPAGGSANEIRKSAAVLRSDVYQEAKTFSALSFPQAPTKSK